MRSLCEGKKIWIFVGLIDNKLINFVGIMCAVLRLSVVFPLICFQITEVFWSSEEIVYLCLLTTLSYTDTITPRSFLSFFPWAMHI